MFPISVVGRAISQEGHVLNKMPYKIYYKQLIITLTCLIFTPEDSIPEHERPSPANPSLQEQLCPPTVLMQFAFTLQSWLRFLHSSISAS